MPPPRPLFSGLFCRWHKALDNHRKNCFITVIADILCNKVLARNRMSRNIKMNLAGHNEWVWNSRWTHWWLKAGAPGTAKESCMEPTFAGALDNDEIAQGVQTLKRAGINTVLTEGLRGLIRFEHEGKTDRVIAAIRRATQACQRAGIRVIHHTTATFVGHELAEIPAACREWLNIDAQTGACAFVKWADDWPGNGWYLWCINNPDFRAEYFRLAAKVVRETGVDGLMTDEVYFRTGWHNCVCPHCRAKFLRQTGLTVPSGEAAYFWGRFDNPAFRAWIRFRAASVGDFYADLQAAIRKARAHPLLLGCKNQAECPASVPLYGDSNEERMRGVNLLFAELCGGTTSILYSWRRLSASFMAYNGLSNYYGTPTMTIMYAAPQESFLSWAIRVAHGVRVWATSGGGALARRHQLLNSPKDLAQFEELFGWEEKHKAELTGAIRPLAAIGILSSAATRNMELAHLGPIGEAWYPYVREWAGWCQTLTDAYRQYATIIEPELTLSGLRQYALVILPDTSCMSDDACQAIVDYVAQGGNLIVTHKAGTCDETGAQRSMPEYRLAKLGFNADAADGSAAFSGPQVARFGKYGLGKWAYFANRPGRIVFGEFNSLGKPRIRNVPSAPAASAADLQLQLSLMMDAVRWMEDAGQPLTVVQAPPGLLIKAFRRPDNNLVVHLLNCRGDSVAVGGMIPADAPPTYPAQADDIDLALRLNSIAQAYLISPDWKGRKPAKVKRAGGGCRITIPAHTLKRYAVLCITAGKPD